MSYKQNTNFIKNRFFYFPDFFFFEPRRVYKPGGGTAFFVNRNWGGRPPPGIQSGLAPQFRFVKKGVPPPSSKPGGAQKNQENKNIDSFRKIVFCL